MSREDRGSELRSYADHHRGNLLVEFWEFARCHKKWWILPIVVVLLVLGVLVLLSGTAAAPFIYTLF